MFIEGWVKKGIYWEVMVCWYFVVKYVECSLKTIQVISFLYVCMVNTIYLLSFVETPRKFIIAELSIRKLGSSSTDKDPSLRIESSAIINLRGVSTKLNKYNSSYSTQAFTPELNVFFERLLVESKTTMR